MSFEQRKREAAKQRKEDQADDRRVRAKLPPAPMTERQAAYLQILCQRHDLEFDPDLSKREASALIDELT